MRRYFPLVFAFFLLPACGLAQTGFPPFGSFDTSQFDAVNRQNLNVNFAIPIVSACIPVNAAPEGEFLQTRQSREIPCRSTAGFAVAI